MYALRSMRWWSVLLLAFLIAGYPTGARAGRIAASPFPVLNLKATYPQAVSIELGLSYQIGDQNADRRHGPFVSYEPGMNGQKVHVGYCTTKFEGLLDKIIVTRVSASHYRAWREWKGFHSGDEFYGLELVVSYNLVLLSGGVYRNTDNPRNYLGSVGVGIGF